jgi:hypothetical protein
LLLFGFQGSSPRPANGQGRGLSRGELFNLLRQLLLVNAKNQPPTSYLVKPRPSFQGHRLLRGACPKDRGKLLDLYSTVKGIFRLLEKITCPEKAMWVSRRCYLKHIDFQQTPPYALHIQIRIIV